MININLQVNGLNKVVEEMQAGSKVAATQIKQALYKASWVVTRAIKEETPVKTGNLRKSIYPDIKDFVATIRPHNAPYAIYVHEGTRYIKRPNPFMDRGVERTAKEVEDIFNKMTFLNT